MIKEVGKWHKESKHSQVHYYEKCLDDVTYRVVVRKEKKMKSEVYTAYELEIKYDYNQKHKVCAYSKQGWKERQLELQEIMSGDYIYNLFGIEKDEVSKISEEDNIKKIDNDVLSES